MRIKLSVLVMILFTIPLAVAQVPPAPSPMATASINGLPAEVQGLASNTTVDVPFTVDFSGSNFVCPEGGSGTVTVTAQGQNPASFVTIAVEPAEGTFNLATAPASTHTGSVPFTLKVTVTEITANASIPILVSASVALAAGQAPCIPSLPAAPEVAPVTTYANITYVPPPVEEPEPPAESPGFELVAVATAVAVGATLMRRKRN